MGIPAYFSHIIKEHRNVLKQISCKKFGKCTHLFLDSNSIIYDVIRSQTYEPPSSKNHQALKEYNIEFDKFVIHEICKQINYYISIINPSRFVMIAFDGVAPAAKLKQQQTRRYKNDYIKNKFATTTTDAVWNTSAITPGTKFMRDLSIGVTDFFNNKKNVLVTASDEAGEGEHKIFEWIRKNKNKPEMSDAKCIIYGLDSDLIMLALQHLQHCNEIYLFRETPHFIKSIDNTLNPNELYALDIPQLSDRVSETMKTLPRRHAISDYIFISFLLGNDFIPHMPALNIRTNGIDRIFDAYRATISKKTHLTQQGRINWSAFKKFLGFLAKNEHNYIKHEYTLREKQEARITRTLHTKTPDEQWDVIPLVDRSTEYYINPDDTGWEWRYYKSLLDVDTQLFTPKNICINYLEALEWTLHYYTYGCKNQQWQYHYHYPPLLNDLYQTAPVFNTNFLEINKQMITPEAQLAYVLPETSSYLLSDEKRIQMKDFYAKTKNPEFHWSFCKYFWEGHIILPPISIE
jgi:5'-3' exonuclease